MGQPMEALLPTTQRASTSNRAPEVVVPPPTRIFRTRETLKLASKFADEFSRLRSKKIKLLAHLVYELIIPSHLQKVIFKTSSSLSGWSQTSRFPWFLIHS